MNSTSKGTLDLAEEKELLPGGMRGHYVRVDGESKKSHVNVVRAGCSSFHQKLCDDIQASHQSPL